MKVLINTHSLVAGGAQRVIFNLIEYLVSNKHEVVLVTELKLENDFYKVSKQIVRYTLGKGNSINKFSGLFNNVYRIRKLRAIFKEENPDIILGMMTVYSVLAIIASLFLKSKVIVSERSFPPKKPINVYWKVLRYLFYRFADGGVALTNETKEWMIKKTALKNTVTIPISIELPLPDKEPYIDVKQWRCGNDFKNIILNIGRLHDVKNQKDAIKAFSFIAKDNPTWCLVIAGKGHLKNQLQNQIDLLGLQRQIFLLGEVGNIADWYYAAEIFLFTSKYEGFGNVLLEAMAHGCTVLSYDCPVGPRNIIKNEVNGVLVSHLDPIKLSKELNRLIRTDRKSYEIKAKAVANLYSNNEVLKLWENYFLQIL